MLGWRASSHSTRAGGCVRKWTRLQQSRSERELAEETPGSRLGEGNLNGGSELHTPKLKSFPAHPTLSSGSQSHCVLGWYLNGVPVASLVEVMCGSIHGPLGLLYR